MPFQLAAPQYDPETDTAEDAVLYNVRLEAGDVVVMATDGVFDNLWDEQLVKLIQQHIQVSGVAACTCWCRFWDKELIYLVEQQIEMRGGAACMNWFKRAAAVLRFREALPCWCGLCPVGILQCMGAKVVQLHIALRGAGLLGAQQVCSFARFEGAHLPPGHCLYAASSCRGTLDMQIPSEHLQPSATLYLVVLQDYPDRTELSAQVLSRTIVATAQAQASDEAFRSPWIVEAAHAGQLTWLQRLNPQGGKEDDCTAVVAFILPAPDALHGETLAQPSSTAGQQALARR